MRLTPDVLRKATSYLNPLKERELDLRGLRIPAIENFGVLDDDYDTLDLSGNFITRVENFPKMKRLKSLLLAGNNINYLSPQLGLNLPNIHTLILSNNSISTLEELEGISGLKSLKTLSIIGNGVTKEENYRRHLIEVLPNLKYLDFNKISAKERDSIDDISEGSDERKSSKRKARTKGGSAAAHQEDLEANKMKRRKKLDAIKEDIKNAKTMEELKEIERRRMELM